MNNIISIDTANQLLTTGVDAERLYACDCDHLIGSERVFRKDAGFSLNKHCLFSYLFRKMIILNLNQCKIFRDSYMIDRF